MGATSTLLLAIPANSLLAASFFVLATECFLLWSAERNQVEDCDKQVVAAYQLAYVDRFSFL